MALTEDDVSGIADYARIALTPEELGQMTAYLNEAIALLDPLLAYDLDDVEPTFHAIGEHANAVRDDVPQAGLSAEAALHGAPSREGQFFRVPAILPGGGASS